MGANTMNAMTDEHDEAAAILSGLPPIFACCISPDGRYRTSRPFGRGGYTYATDTRIVVRTPRESPPVEGAPSAWALQGWRAEYAAPVRLPGLDAILTACAVCLACDGDGRSASVVCEYCDEEFQVFDPDRGRYVACRACRATGWMPAPRDPARACAMCGGSGVDLSKSWPLHVPAGTVSISPAYAAVLLRHGVTEVSPPSGGGHRPVRFAGDGFEGLLMPVAVRASEPIRD